MAKRNPLAAASLRLGILATALPVLVVAGISVLLSQWIHPGAFDRPVVALGIQAFVRYGVPLAAGGAILFGHLARARIRNAGGQLTGRGSARMGLALGYACLVAYVAIPNLTAPREGQASACAANRNQIEGAKATWALEHRKQAPATPTDPDLFGPGKYVRQKPLCPAGGTYSLNPWNVKTTCSIPGHTH